jgi:hypothetical protein
MNNVERAEVYLKRADEAEEAATAVATAGDGSGRLVLMGRSEPSDRSEAVSGPGAFSHPHLTTQCVLAVFISQGFAHSLQSQLVPVMDAHAHSSSHEPVARNMSMPRRLAR